MSYDEELEYLRKEFKKSEAKFHEAEREGWHTDANIYEDNMANLGYQIHIHEQAAKADEYEAKAKAFDRIVEERNRIGKLMHNKEYPQVFTDEAFWNIDDIIIDTESGGTNA